ncbi:MAG: ABC transporter ATP-binding protein [Chromatiales bacterium]|nr:ABC transporter ATP-binding protein [Chromatiales bacterium]
MKAALHISNLDKVYPNGQVALQDVSLTVKHGDFFALLGPNGAGKSTTIGVITSLIKKTAGKVHIYGLDIDTHFTKAKKYIGLVPQEFSFNQFEPVIEILINQAGYYGVPPRKAQRYAREYLQKLGLWEKRDQEARNLSGGMKRRLMIARAMLHHPQLLILDEPTAGVDIEIRRMIWSFLSELNQRGTTIILTTHYLEEAEKLCRNIAIIDEGKIITDTTMRDLLNSSDSESFTLYLAEPITLDNMPTIDSVTLKQIDAYTLEVITSSKTDLGQVFTELSRHNIRLLSLRNTSNRLEELFLKLVADHDSSALVGLQNRDLVNGSQTL